ncbi:MAG TPA: heavy metal translocating P-type ATPase, partial [Anaerolineae bacterium]|nr:heavy metal translocating P-type ATPase [Anaerolineae bacterium]HNU04532.1 heavy metal translocating P-type ATPase [Anaerolineae bacterium]
MMTFKRSNKAQETRTAVKSGLRFLNRKSAQGANGKSNGANGKAPIVIPSVDGSIGVIGVTATDGETQIHFQVKHWVKGRLRLVIPRLATDPEYGERLQYRIMATSEAFTVRINPKAQSLVVIYDPTQHDPPTVLEQVVISIKDAAAPAVMLEKAPVQVDESEFRIDYKRRLGLPALALVLGAGTLTGVIFPPLLVGGVMIAAAIPSYKRAWEGIRHERKLNVDFLDSTAITLLTATGSFFPPALMIGLIESGEIIRDLTARRTARANLDLLDALGSTARIERDGVEVEVPLQEVEVGDVVVVYPGDQIPVDGVVLSGVGLVDQQKLTGESIPILREEGQDVLAATLVMDGALRIETRRTGDNTRAGVVVGLMKAAPIHDTRMEDYARKVGDKVVIPTLALGAAVFATTGMLHRGVSVITMDIGTGVRVSVPTAILSTLTYAARQGVLIRSGRAIEQLAMVDTIVFDKTGTLTQGNAGVVGIYTTRAELDGDTILQLAATAEQGLTHPVAEAITRHARQRSLPLKECEEWEFRVGQGVAAMIDGRQVYVGSHRMMGILGFDTDPLLAAHPEIEAMAASQVFVADDQGVLGVILYRDPPRHESAEVIRQLVERGITPYMLSGDMKKVADAVAAELGIAPEHVYAEAFPERKVEVVKALEDSGKKVVFVGDGINDSAALAHAAVSVSFAGATDMARETAEVVLMDNNLTSLITAIDAAKRAMRTVRENVGIVVVPNVAGMAAAALVGISPAIAVVLNNGAAIVAEMNGFRPLLGPAGLRARLPWRQKPAALLPAASLGGAAE